MGYVVNNIVVLSFIIDILLFLQLIIPGKTNIKMCRKLSNAGNVFLLRGKHLILSLKNMKTSNSFLKIQQYMLYACLTS